MYLQIALDKAIKVVCPIDGISFGKLDDKSTWRIDYRPEATDDQRKAAIDVLNAFAWTPELEEQQRKLERDEQYKNDLSVKANYQVYLASNPGVTFSQYLDYLESLDVF